MKKQTPIWAEALTAVLIVATIMEIIVGIGYYFYTH